MSMERPSGFVDEENKYGIDYLPEVKGGECSFGRVTFGKDEERAGKELKVSKFKLNTLVVNNRRSIKRNNTA